jgi:hypothetical protein
MKEKKKQLQDHLNGAQPWNRDTTIACHDMVPQHRKIACRFLLGREIECAVNLQLAAVAAAMLKHAISIFHDIRILFNNSHTHTQEPVSEPHAPVTAQAVTVALPLLHVTVVLPSTQTGPIPNRLFATVIVSNSQPPQPILLVVVFGGTVIVHPKGEVEVTVLVQVGDAEQAVIVVVPGRVVGGQT